MLILGSENEFKLPIQFKIQFIVEIMKSTVPRLLIKYYLIFLSAFVKPNWVYGL